MLLDVFNMNQESNPLNHIVVRSIQVHRRVYLPRNKHLALFAASCQTICLLPVGGLLVVLSFRYTFGLILPRI